VRGLCISAKRKPGPLTPTPLPQSRGEGVRGLSCPLSRQSGERGGEKSLSAPLSPALRGEGLGVRGPGLRSR